MNIILVALIGVLIVSGSAKMQSVTPESTAVTTQPAHLIAIRTHLDSILKKRQSLLENLSSVDKHERSRIIREYLETRNKISILDSSIQTRANESQALDASFSMEQALEKINKFEFEGVPDLLEKAMASSDETLKFGAIFLLGKAYSDQMDYSRAAQYFQRAGSDNECPCTAHALHLAASMLKESNDVSEAERLLKQLVDSHPNYPLRTSALLDLIEILESRESWNEIIQTLDSSLLINEEILFRKSNALMKVGKTEAAEELLMTLYLDFPAGVHNKQVEAQYMDLLKKRGLNEPPIAPQQSFSRAEKLDKAGIRSEAAHIYAKLAAMKSVPLELKSRCILLRAKILHDLRQNEEALKLYDSFIKAYPSHPSVPVALIRMGTLHRRLNNDQDYLKDIAKIESNFPKSESWSEAINGRGEYYRGKGETLKAAQDFEKVATNGTGEERYVAMWKRAWISYDQKQYEDASKRFGQLADVQKGTGWEAPSHYWKARSLENNGQIDEAYTTYTLLANRFRWLYPGFRSREKLKSAGREIPEKWNPEPMGALSDLEIAQLPVRCAKILETSGFHDRAALEYQLAANKAKPASKALIKKQADCLARSNQPAQARKILVDEFKTVLDSGKAPREIARLYYPLPSPIFPVIKSESQTHQLDPLFVSSLILQESGFDAAEVSDNLAAGYMQLMPDLFTRMSTDWTPVPKASERFEPEKNIRAGITYLKLLLDRYNGIKAKALAAYNAGEFRVDEWDKQYSEMDEETWIEHIAYQQTRLFAKKIYENYECYRMIYENEAESGSKADTQDEPSAEGNYPQINEEAK